MGVWVCGCAWVDLIVFQTCCAFRYFQNKGTNPEKLDEKGANEWERKVSPAFKSPPPDVFLAGRRKDKDTGLRLCQVHDPSLPPDLWFMASLVWPPVV